MDSRTIHSLTDEILVTILKHSLEQPALDKSHLESSTTYVWPAVTPVPAPPLVADVARNLLIASVCRRWRRLTKLHVETISVKEDLVVSLEDLSVAVACFPNLTHLHLSDNSIESVDDAFLAHLAASCPKLTRFHVGRSFGRVMAIDVDSWVEHYRRKGHPLTTECLDHFFQKLPHLEQLTLFCLHQEMQLPNSLFQLTRLHTFLLTNALALDNPGFTSLTALTTLYVSCPMNHRHLSTLLCLPRLHNLSTLVPHDNHLPAGAASITLPSCLKSLNLLISCPNFATIFPSASPFIGLEELLITNSSGLESLPDRIGNLLPFLNKLTIRRCHDFARLPESFTSLRCLKTLVVSGCNRFTLPSNFGHLPALKVLVLESLCFTELPHSFCHLTCLKAFSLDDCVFRRKLPAGFCHLTALKELSMSVLNVTLPEDVGALASLKVLKCFNSQHRPLPASFTHLSSLTCLELISCLQFKLPEALGELSSLQELKLYGLLVSTLPISLTLLTRLQTLEISHCLSLEEIPFQLDTFVGLKRLEVTDCEELSTPPEGFPPSLKVLCLGRFRENSFHEVDISKLSQLRVLKLDHVRVRCGPAMSSRFSCLEKLEMCLEDENPELPAPLTLSPRLHSLQIKAPEACRIPDNLLAALTQLRRLKFRFWSPTKLPGSIVELTSLTSLKICAFELTSLPQGMSRLVRLRRLELTRCHALQHLPEFLTQLHRLMLHDTSISSLPANLVQLTEER